MNPWLEKMKRTGRQTLTFKQMFFHYFFALFLPLTICLITYVLIHINHQEATSAARVLQSSINKLAAFVGLAYLIRQYVSLKMKFVPFQGNLEDFDQVVNGLILKENWVLESKGEGYFVCTIPFKWNTWGTLMTIVKTDAGVYFNSICDVYNRPSTTSFGKNSENKRKIQQAFTEQSSK